MIEWGLSATGVLLATVTGNTRDWAHVRAGQGGAPGAGGSWGQYLNSNNAIPCFVVVVFLASSYATERCGGPRPRIVETCLDLSLEHV